MGNDEEKYLSTPDDTIRQDSRALERSRALSLANQRPPLDPPGYTIGPCLGQGAYGSVWKGTELHTGRTVAIKFYMHRAGLDWSLLSREVEKLAVLYTSRDIVKLINVGWDSSPPYYVMEYLENGSLAGLLNERALSVHESVSMMRIVLQALVHAHGSGILHCDIKPANILLDRDFHPRLADFGQSRLSHEQKPALGTLFYMAPEQADVSAVPDARWDVYAIGAVLYQCLCGSLPRSSPEHEKTILAAQTVEERLQKYQKILRESPKPEAHRKVRGVDRRLAEIVERCLEVDPARRFPNAQAVLDALNARERHRSKQPLLLLGTIVPLALLIGFGTIGSQAFDAAVKSASDSLIERALESDAVAARILSHSLQRELEYRTAELLKVSADSSVAASILDEKSKPWEQRTLLRKSLDVWKSLVDTDRKMQNQELDTSWFLTDHEGIQIYRNPVADTIGGDYAFRDYFHGKKLKNTKRGDKYPPIVEPYVSLPYLSDAASNEGGYGYRVAITVPVFNPQNPQEVIGVLGRSMELGKLLKGYKEKIRDISGDQVERVISLIDSRDYSLLDHDWMTDANLRNLIQTTSNDASKSNRSKQIILGDRERNRMEALQNNPSMQQVDRDDSYQDPVGKLDPQFRDTWLAAFWPIENTDWIAIVQERKQPAFTPVESLRHQLFRFGVFGLVLCAVLVACLWYFILRLIIDRSSTLAGSVLNRTPQSSRKSDRSTLPTT